MKCGLVLGLFLVGTQEMRDRGLFLLFLHVQSRQMRLVSCYSKQLSAEILQQQQQQHQQWPNTRTFPLICLHSLPQLLGLTGSPRVMSKDKSY